MKYWIIKGNPKWYVWDDDLDPGYVENWGARSLPADFAAGDRLFLWESGGRRRIIGFGEVVATRAGRDRDGRRPFDVRYLTNRFQTMPGIDELRKLPVLNSAQFLQSGPFATVYALSSAQARSLYQFVIQHNRHEHIWRDLGGAKTIFPPPDIEAEAMEGSSKLVTHLRRERVPALAKKKKEQFRRKYGRLFCEACNRGGAAYGKLADHAFEVHHLRLIGGRKKATKTRLADLGLLCATCHRVIHQMRPMPAVAAFRRALEGAVATTRPKP